MDKPNYKQNPFYKRNLELEEFYHTKEEEALNKKARRLKAGPFSLTDIIVIIILLVSFLTPLVIIYTNKGRSDTRIRAGTNQVKFYLYPKDINVVKDGTFTLTPKIVDSLKKNIQNVNYTIGFDPTSVNLAEINRSAMTSFQGKYEFSSLDYANRTGRLEILLETDPSETAPSGVINLPELIFIATNEGESNIAYSISESKVSFSNGETAEVAIDNPSKVIVQPRP